MPSPLTTEQIAMGVVILAAGASRRMGKPKLLLPWGSTSVLGHLLQQCQRLGARQVGVVRATTPQVVEIELDHLGFPKENRILNSTPDRGMFSSIQCAANWRDWSADLTHWLIMLGDQPHLRFETLRELIEFGARNPGNICQPMHHGHRRHPILLPKKIFVELQDASATDLKQFLQGHSNELAGFESDDPGLGLDIDTPADYEQARRIYFDETSSTSPQ